MNDMHSSSGVPKRSHKGTLNVLIIDDHEVFRQGLMGLVKSIKGFHVIADVGTLQEALAVLEHVHVDLVLLDLSLRDSEGVESVHQLKKVAASPAIIIISASIDDATLLEVVLAGVSGYLTKDTSATDMEKALQGYQRGELAMLPTVMTTLVQLLLQHNQLKKPDLNTSLHTSNSAFAGEKPSSTEVVSSTANHEVTLSSTLPPLTPQEEKVLQLMHRGYSNKQIATKLFISRFTVGKHVQNIFRKLGVTNRTQAVSYTSFEGDKT